MAAIFTYCIELSTIKFMPLLYQFEKKLILILLIKKMITY